MWDKLSPRDKLPPQDIKAVQVVSAKVQGVATSMHRHQALLLQDERAALDEDDESRSEMREAALDVEIVTSKS